MAQGECNCGAIKYETQAELKDVFVCHCSICRKATGSGGIAVVIVKNDTFRWRQGTEQLRTWRKPGHDWHTCFCEVCGASMPGTNDDEHMNIPLVTLISGMENLQVSHHLWASSKGGWEVIADGGKVHNGHINS